MSVPQSLTLLAGEMLSGAKIKQILYSTIDETGKENVQIEYFLTS